MSKLRNQLLFEGSPPAIANNVFSFPVLLLLIVSGPLLVLMEKPGTDKAVIGWMLFVFATPIASLVAIGSVLRCTTTKVRVTSDRTSITTGLLVCRTVEVRHVDVRSIEVTRSLPQRMAGVGDVSLSTSAGHGAEIVIKGIANPDGLASLIRAQQSQHTPLE